MELHVHRNTMRRVGGRYGPYSYPRLHLYAAPIELYELLERVKVLRGYVEDGKLVIFLEEPEEREKGVRTGG